MKRTVQLLVGVYMYVLKRRNKKMNIRMIGFDLDGTLLTTEKVLTERTKNALKKRQIRESFWCRQRGVLYADFRKNF